MARTQGARNAHYDARRRELLDMLRERLARPDAPHPSYRELAQACGVAQTTLRHYFGSRDELIVAVLAAWRERGEEIFGHLAEPSGPLRKSIRDLLEFHAQGHRISELRQLHRVALTEGLRSSAIGPQVVSMLLEPGVDAAATRLRGHISRGEMRACDPHVAAFVLLAPTTMAFIQQQDLAGRPVRPSGLRKLVAAQVDEFVTAYGTPPS